MNSFLIVHQGAIGDFLLSLPALEAIHSFHPQVRFNFFGRPAILEIISSRPYFGEVLDSVESRWAPLYQSNFQLHAKAFGSFPPVDKIFAFCRATSEPLVDNLAALLGTSAYTIDPFPDPDLKLSVADYQCKQLEELGIPAIPASTAITAPSKQDLLRAREFVRQHVTTGERLVFVHPGSGSRKKIWNLTGWLDIIARLSCYNGFRIVLLQGPADTHIIGELRSQLQTVPFVMIKNWNLGKLAALLSQAALYLGNDSGITHLAAACAIPTIALFGPSDPRIWGPRGAQVTIIRWQAQRPSRGAPTKSEDNSDAPPETELVWEQVKKWLIV